MTTLCKWCITLVVCALIAKHGAAQTVAITSSQETNSSYKMDETWSTVAAAAGYPATIYPTTILSDPDLRSKSDILIIASGTSSINQSQRSNILKFLKAGGNIYIQSEYLPTLDGNITFKYLLENTGSSFAWDELSDNNIGPMNIINGFQTGINNDQLDYFWYGTNGCGDGQVTPFIEVDDKYYAFYYRSVNSSNGNLITNTDHDWIRRINDNRAPREALMNKMLDVLVSGLNTNSNYQPPTITLQDDINYCTDNTITATVTQANDQDIHWYLNDATATAGPTFDISNLNDGDSLYAEVLVNSGCGTLTATSETIVVSRRNYSPTRETSFTDQESICPGSPVVVTLIYDVTLPNIRHNWFLNGKDTPVRTDHYSSDNFNDGDIIEHAFTYFDGCQDVVLITEGSVKIKWEEVSIPSIQINGQSTFCSDSIAELSLSQLNIENPIIKWFSDNSIIEEDKLNITIEASSQAKDVFATISYYDNCSGWVTTSTPIVRVSVQSLQISLVEKANHDCEHGEGFIEVYSNVLDALLEWSTGQSGNYIANLPLGIFRVTATSSLGCTTSESYEIGKTVFPLLESLDIVQPTCNNGHGKVNLNLADNNLNGINVSWVNNQGHVVSTDQSSQNLTSGKYQIIIDVNGNCSETHIISINNYYIDQDLLVDTMIVEQGELISLSANTKGYEGHSIEWQSHPDLSCFNCFNPELFTTEHQRFRYSLISDQGCRMERDLIVLVKLRDPYYAPSGFSPNNDGINDYYKIYPRWDVFPTSSLKVFDRWGSLIHEEESHTRGWGGKSFGHQIQKGIYVYFQQFEDTSGKKYTAKGSITIFN